MKAKIFAKLKQEYSALGLGNEILMARAESLAATGLITDDNIDAVVAVQKRELEDLQKANDKRVNDALEKERKKHEEELAKIEADRKAKAEAKAKKEAEEKAAAEKAAAEKAAADKKAEEDAKAKAEEERKAKEAEDAASKKLVEDGKISAEVAELLKQEREKTASTISAYEGKMKEYLDLLTAAEAKRNEEMETLRKTYAELSTANKTLSDSYESLKKEKEAEAAAKALADRKNFITAKAKELGVPDWRVEEGFAIADDATDEAIVDTLTKVANNVKTQLLPSNRVAHPLSDSTPTKVELADLAKSIVK